MTNTAKRMLEIFLIILGIIIPLGLAKHRKGRGRSMKNYMRGECDENLVLGTLASQTLVGGNFDEAVTERTLISSLVATYAVQDATDGSGIGPILVGIAHSDYSDAEIEAWIETTTSWETSDLIGQEVAGRLCRKVGILTVPETIDFQTSLNDGKPITTKLNWVLNTGQTIKLWAYNLGTSAFATTSPVIRLQGHVNLWTL